MMQKCLPGGILAAAVAMLCLDAGPAEAQQFVYRPTNPAFGGNPLNQQWLISTAQAQMPGEERTPFTRDPLQNFQEGLQRQILSALSRELVSSRFGRDLDFSQEGRYDMGDFIVEVVPGMEGVNIFITNALTGDQTSVTIPTF